MTTSVVTMISILIGIIGTIFEHRYSTEEQAKRKQGKLDEAFAGHDIDFIAVELEHYYRMLDEKNRDTTRQ